MRSIVEKIKKVREPFKIKASNMSQVKDYLAKEIRRQK
jgi:hypothetical protein